MITNKYLSLFLVFNASIIQAKPDEVEGYKSCGENRQAIKLAKLIMTANNQRRSKLICNQKLSSAVSIKAKLMARESKVAHDIDNTSPNQHLKKFWYRVAF